jgi:hypothetical protein
MKQRLVPSYLNDPKGQNRSSIEYKGPLQKLQPLANFKAKFAIKNAIAGILMAQQTGISGLRTTMNEVLIRKLELENVSAFFLWKQGLTILDLGFVLIDDAFVD